MNKFSFITMVCALSVLVFSVLNYCEKREVQSQTITISRSDTVLLVDTGKHATITNNLYATNVYTLAPGKIDTAEILRLFFTKRFVADSLQDSLVKIHIYDTLFNNSIVYRKKQYQLLKPYQKQITTTTTTTLIPAPVSQNGIYLGMFFGFNSSLQSAGIEANYTTQKFNYGLGYDFKNEAVTGKLLFRINKK